MTLSEERKKQMNLNWHKNKDRYNKQRREKRENDPAYAESIRKAQRKDYQNINKWCVKMAWMKKINKEYIKKIFPDNWMCPLLDIKMEIGGGKNGGASENSPSIHRIKPELGYKEDNIIVVSMLANRIMSNATMEQVRMVGKRMEMFQ